MKIGFCGLLALLFIGLKLADVIVWSWWWVTSPLWVPPLVALLFGLCCLVALLWKVGSKRG